MFRFRTSDAVWHTVERELKPTQLYFGEKDLSLEREEYNANTYLYGDGDVKPFEIILQGRLVFSSPAELKTMKDSYQTKMPNVDRFEYQNRTWVVSRAFFYFTYANDHRQANVTLKFIPTYTNLPVTLDPQGEISYTWGSVDFAWGSTEVSFGDS